MDILASISKNLSERGFSINPNFLNQEDVLAYRQDLQALCQTNSFRKAGVGKNSSLNEEIRRDEIFWLNQETGNSVQQNLFSHMTKFQEAMNQNLFLGLREFEGHYALYPPGGFYQRHLDCFRKDDARTVTVILYLNPEWSTKDGGQLRMHLADSTLDIEPRGGTLVSFLSREIEHEVLKSERPRMSFTGWFKSASTQQYYGSSRL